jgi:hypothetical protein
VKVVREWRLLVKMGWRLMAGGWVVGGESGISEVRRDDLVHLYTVQYLQNAYVSCRANPTVNGHGCLPVWRSQTASSLSVFRVL